MTASVEALPSLSSSGRAEREPRIQERRRVQVAKRQRLSDAFSWSASVAVLAASDADAPSGLAIREAYGVRDRCSRPAALVRLLRSHLLP
jgi:hypothetical protein